MQRGAPPRHRRTGIARCGLALWTVALAGLACPVHGGDPPYISHVVPSEFQQGKAEIRVILPKDFSRTAKYRTLYVLPVEVGFEAKFGDPLASLSTMGFPTSSGFVCVMVGYPTAPWFGDHPTEKTQQQGRHLIERVIPFVEQQYAVSTQRDHRFLLGFSKSGWGAASLLMRYPDAIGYAGTWDAPWCMDGLVWGLHENFGTQQAMDANRPDLLAPRVAARFKGSPRLVVTGEEAWGLMRPLAGGDNARSHTVAFHALLEKHAFPHVYRNDLAFPHRWDERWMRPVLETLLRIAKNGAPRR
jgi:hypothetical protein